MNKPHWLALAKKEIGTKEIVGPEHNPRVIEYHQETTLKAKDDEVAWCSAFVCWVMENSGVPSTRSASARSWLKWGAKLEEPTEGCVVVFKRGNSTWQGHVGFFMGFEGQSIKVLGGNQSNAVNIKKYPKSKLLGYRWPEQMIKSNNFDIEIEEVLRREGGYSNHPADRGGATNYGITIGVLKKWRKDNNLTPEDVKNMSVDEAKQIYKAKYWDPLSLDEIKSQHVAGVIFDQGVNAGIRTSAKRAQKVVGVTADGAIGPVSLKAINQFNETQFLFEFFKLSQHHYAGIIQRNISQAVFLKGWLNRSYGLIERALDKN